MKNLINTDGSVNFHNEFKIPNSDKRLKMIGTRSTDWMKDSFKKSAWQCVDSIKNLDTGKITDIPRQKLHDYKPIVIS